MKNILLGFLFLSLLIVACTDDPEFSDTVPPCETNRYLSPTFSNLDSTTVMYGKNLSVLGVEQELRMDIYTPQGDEIEQRPVIIWAFGGAFIGGNRGDVAFLARDAARRGYVSATIDYRLLSLANGIPDSLAALDIAIKAMGDMKAAVKYFKWDAGTNNQFKVDPNQIYLGGVSAGAITALHAASVKEEDLTEQFINEIIERNGGIDGSSALAETASYDTNVKGVINLSGAVYRLEFLDSGDPEIISFHGDNDDVVPYNFGFTEVFGIKIIPLYGSNVINDYCQTINLRSSLTTVEGGDHTMIYTEPQYAGAREQFTQDSYSFFKEIICR